MFLPFSEGRIVNVRFNHISRYSIKPFNPLLAAGAVDRFGDFSGSVDVKTDGQPPVVIPYTASVSRGCVCISWVYMPSYILKCTFYLRAPY